MDQGKDILQSLSFSTSGIIKYHTWFALLAVLWWSWQSWRAARITLHFTTLDFAKFNQKYALQAQVFVPRLLGILPALIFALGLYQVSGWSNPLVYLYVSLALWLYVLYHLRKDIIVFFMSRNKIRFLNIPDYVMVKNEAYPARFIWAKQGYWILFRLFLVAVVFTIVILEPVAFPQLLGAATIVLFALGAWLVIPDLVQKFLPFPLYAVDRAKALEYSWEKASEMDTASLLQEGFLNAWQQDESVVIFNATRAENGFRTLVSNVQTPPTIFHRTEDFFKVVENDTRLSTAISVSARFPFITPPAVIESNGKKWGHLVDGGYVENMGAASLLELYRFIAQRAKEKQYKTKFILFFIKNTKEE